MTRTHAAWVARWQRSRPGRAQAAQLWRRHLGRPAFAALTLLVASAALWSHWVPELRRDQARLLAREQALAAAAALPSDPLTRRALETLSPDDMPSLRQRGQDLERLVAAAQRHGLTLRRADYSAGAPVGGRLIRVEAALPLYGTYAQLRPFIAGVLNELPHAALDSLQLERQNAQSAQLQVSAKWVLFYRQEAP